VVPLLRKTEPIYVQSDTRAEKVVAATRTRHIRYLDF
jgi:hypothetical protein